MAKAQVMFRKIGKNPFEKLPLKATTGAAAYDVFCSSKTVIQSGRSAKIPVGIAMRLPPSYAAIVMSRSGMFLKRGLTVFNGLIDNDFHNEIEIIGLNNSYRKIIVEVGERFAQLLVIKYADFTVKEVTSLARWPTNNRGGFGSTGQFNECITSRNDVASNQDNVINSVHETVMAIDDSEGGGSASYMCDADLGIPQCSTGDSNSIHDDTFLNKIIDKCDCLV